MKQTITTCDICGQEVDRWYEVSVNVGAKYEWQNVADMMEIDGVHLISVVMEPVRPCFCKDCVTVLVKAVKRLRRMKRN